MSRADADLDPVIILGAEVTCGALRYKPHPQTDDSELFLLSG